MILGGATVWQTRIAYPRKRGGDPYTFCTLSPMLQLIPASAGVILSAISKQLEELTYPRKRGGDPTFGVGKFTTVALSPQARG